MQPHRGSSGEGAPLGRFGNRALELVRSGLCVHPNLLSLRVLLYQDLDGPRGNGPGIRVNTSKRPEHQRDRNPGSDSRVFVFLGLSDAYVNSNVVA